MPTFRNGSIHLFRLAGVDVSLNWTWFLVAAYSIEARSGVYSSVLWNVLEYLALFLIVLTHEFGHAMACRQVGGTANRILLWPFGGVAYVDPPQRPGAMLWSIVAGPLVNVALIPVILGVFTVSKSMGWEQTMPDAYQFLWEVFKINVGLLIFNILPIYPLDGGKIVWSLLWFGMGRARSLMVATVLGFIGIAGLFGLALLFHEVWFGLICIYLVVSCWNGFKYARILLKVEKQPRRQGFACPSCRNAPPLGAKWKCSQCEQAFDTFDSHAVCPNCAARYDRTICLFCGKWHPMSEWIVGAVPGAGAINGQAIPK
jgi:Zn-dependent protease